jgi:hypothetical protein
MPEFHDVLADAAVAAQPTSSPPFETIERRSVRRQHRRRAAGAAAAASVALVGGLAFAEVSGSGSSRTPVAAPTPCATPLSEQYTSDEDIAVAIPAAGEVRVTLLPGKLLTVGWLTCTENGTITNDDPDGRLLGFTEKHLPGSDAQARHQITYRGSRPGTVTITGAGSQGSHGKVVVTLAFPAEPVGNSDPSPYPIGAEATPTDPIDVCEADHPADDNGRLTQAVSFEGDTNRLRPAGSLPSNYSRKQALERVMNSPFRIQGPAKAYFGLITVANPARVNAEGQSVPVIVDRPAWLVFTCEGPEFLGHGGPMPSHDQPAPGTSPTPGAHAYGVRFTSMSDTNGTIGDTYMTGRTSPAQRAERLIEVPFTRNHDDQMDGQQIGITYSAGEDCASFDHLDVRETDDTVYVQVWLHVTGSSCETDGQHDAVVGLLKPLGDRELVRGAYAP